MCGSVRRTNTDNYSNSVAHACQGVIKVDKILYANCIVENNESTMYLHACSTLLSASLQLHLYCRGHCMSGVVL